MLRRVGKLGQGLEEGLPSGALRPGCRLRSGIWRRSGLGRSRHHQIDRDLREEWMTLLEGADLEEGALRVKAACESPSPCRVKMSPSLSSLPSTQLVAGARLQIFTNGTRPARLLVTFADAKPPRRARPKADFFREFFAKFAEPSLFNETPAASKKPLTNFLLIKRSADASNKRAPEMEVQYR